MLAARPGGAGATAEGEEAVTLTLRPYQDTAIAKLRASYQSGHRAPLLVAPTGAGKTIIGSYIIQAATQLVNRSLFVAPRRELIGQTVRKLAEAGVWDVRVIQAANDTGRPDAPVIVGSIQTLTMARWLPRLPQADLVIADEAHHMAADQWGKLAGAYPRARWLGLTATPERADGRPLGDVFDDLIVAATTRELTELGNLVPCRVYAPLNKLDAARVALDPVDAYAKHAGGQLAVVFCVTVEHAEQTAAAFNDGGVTAAVITGRTPAAQRDVTLQRFAGGDVRVLVNCGVLTEGWDCPPAAVAILARRFGHAGLFLQVIGRVLRPHPGKECATVVDLCGSVHEHGPPDMDREYSLTGKAISSVKRDAIRQCPSCGAVFLLGPTACPECGAVLPRKAAELPRSTGEGVVDIATLPAAARSSYTLSITAKFPGRCRACTGRIAPGEQIWWGKGEKPRHVECPRAEAA